MSVPLLLIAAGTCDATDATAPWPDVLALLAVDVLDDELDDELLLPHPTIAAAHRSDSGATSQLLLLSNVTPCGRQPQSPEHKQRKDGPGNL